MFMKPIDQITLIDINDLIEKLRFKENERIEYKRGLPSKDGADPWIESQTNIGDYAIKKLTAEVIGFANTYGGSLVVGIQETNETPPRPEKIIPMPNCHELDKRLMMAIIDCIEPRLASIQSHVVETDDNGNGIILIHVDRSTYAPHRSKKDHQCYMRIQDRCSKMTMTEIQKTTLKRSRQKIEGLWSAKFGISDQFMNAGMVVLEDGKLYGGDSQYFYTGIFELRNEEDLASNIWVEHFHGDPYTAFDTNEKKFAVTLIGQLKDNNVIGTLYKHSPPQKQLQVILERKRELI